jgi:hypothetical protein
VQFSVDGVPAGTAVAVSAGKAAFATSALAAGSHLVRADYSGDSTNGPSSGLTTATVNTVLTTTVVTSNRVPTANLGQTVTFTAAVTAATGTLVPTGTVQFAIDGVPAGAAVTLNALGRATYATATLSAGSHTVVATYGGSAIHAASTSAGYAQVVNQATPTVVVTSNRNPSVFGQSVTLTARVTPLAATGTVQFTVGGVASGGPVVVDATGRARLVTSALSVGTHAVTATYSGNVNYRAATSATLTQTVAKATSRVVVRSSSTTAVRGTTVTFTATVTAVAHGSDLPTGTVQFQVDGVSLGSPRTLGATGQATIATGSLAVGTHTVVAVYSGDSRFNGRTSGAITQRIV